MDYRDNPPNTAYRITLSGFKSLSAAATAIAGTRWNGPRFFGLRSVK